MTLQELVEQCKYKYVKYFHSMRTGTKEGREALVPVTRTQHV